MEVSVVGDVNPDLLLRMDTFPKRGKQSFARGYTLKLGGSAANTAWALGRLGVIVHFFGCVGRDLFGDFCVEELWKAGVDARVERADVPTGVSVAVEEGEERTLFTYRGANEFLDTTRITPLGTWLHVSGFWHIPSLRRELLELLRKAKQEGVTTSFDFGGWSNSWEGAKVVVQALEGGLLDVLFCDEDELRAFTGKGLEEAVTYVAKYALLGLHMGPKGARIVGRSVDVHVPAPRVEKRVKTGAGDVWNAGFIYGYLTTKDPKRAGEIAMDVVGRYMSGMLT